MTQQPVENDQSISGDRNDDDWLIEFLRQRDVPCPGCSYNLRGLVSGRCPECGQALRLGVHLAEPYLKAWIALVAASCACGGLGVFFALALLRSGGPPGTSRALWAVILINLAMIPVPVIVVWARRRLLRLAHANQWMLAGLAIAVLVLTMVLFLLGSQ